MPLSIDSASLTISSLSREYVKVRVTGEREGLPVDPTTFAVEFAFTTAASPPTEPDDSDWVTGSWEASLSEDDHYLARVLVGPETNAVLADGTYDVWLRFDDATERPVRRVGRIIVT